eukprot:TRINITY_DN17013_c0_g3_i1.p1 TRINITY_DN17013_c0_g3~~TRINITY_DN17013_c0_g3_i1.p1  ORF type:complete len:529 (+),score=137.72 TRINITY_DN17013_c0_g3_i1:103-1587(+)
MAQSQDERVGEIIKRIQVFAYPRRLRMREFFYDFDHLKCGRCTRMQLHRALATMKFTEMSEADAELLAEYFTEHGPNIIKPQVVNYYKLCDMVEEVYVDGNPDPLQSASSPGSTMMASFVPNDWQEEEQVMHVLHRIASLCKARGVHFKECFLDYANPPIPNPARQNPIRGGKCTVPQFLRSFPFTNQMGEADINLILERYKTPKGDVHFQALHNDVSAVMDTEPPPFPTSPLVMRPDQTEWAHTELNPVDKIKSKVIEKRMRLYEHFQDYDPLRKGYCTVGQVKAVFTLLNIGREINKFEFDKLIYAFMREDGLFCYADFCAEVDAGFTRPNLEREPRTVITMPDATSTSPARRNTIKLHEQRRREALYIEEQVRSKVRKHRILLKPMFVDMDRAKRGFVTRNQFMRVMGNLGFELSELEVGMLAGIYCNNGNHLDFNYVDFLHAVDPPDQAIETAMQQVNAPYKEFEPAKYFDTFGYVQPFARGMRGIDMRA